MKRAIIAAALSLAAPNVVFAANAGHPYSNVDHRNDAGNDTGDAQVDRLNQAQLGGNGAPSRLDEVRRGVAPQQQATIAYPPLVRAPAPVYVVPPYAAYVPYAVPYFAAYPRPFFYRRPFFYPYW